MSEWTSVKDRLPEPGIYLSFGRHISDSKPTIRITTFGEEKDYFYDAVDGGRMYVTYWRPLPEPPHE
jgi:hypothetical protein